VHETYPLTSWFPLGFGDVYYKLPCSGPLGKFTHKRYIDALSAAEEPGKVPMNEQYNAYFYGYRTPPYITPRPESSTVAVSEGDIIILASDGLWDRVTTLDAAEAVWSGMQTGVPNLAGSLLQSATDRRPPGDDTTIVVLHWATEAGEGGPTANATGQRGTSEKGADDSIAQLQG
jgi:pyruvate dehydrogenase phosphatase